MSGLSLPPWQVNLAVVALLVAIAALWLSIWDKLRVAVWNLIAPVEVTFDRRLFPELDEQYTEIPEGTVDGLRIRIRVRNRVDYRLKVALGVAMSRGLLESSAQEVRDQIDGAWIADTKDSNSGEEKMTFEVEAFQSRHVWLRVVVRSGSAGYVSPGATIFASRRRGVRRVVKRAPFSVEVTWAGKIHRYQRVPTRKHKLWARATKSRR